MTTHFAARNPTSDYWLIADGDDGERFIRGMAGAVGAEVFRLDVLPPAVAAALTAERGADGRDEWRKAWQALDAALDAALGNDTAPAPSTQQRGAQVAPESIGEVHQ